jgi:hypothetical protein
MLALYKNLLASRINAAPSEGAAFSVTRANGSPAPVTSDLAGPGFQMLLPRLLQQVSADNPLELVADARVQKALEAAIAGRLAYADLLRILDEYSLAVEHSPTGECSPTVEHPPALTQRKQLRTTRFGRFWGRFW